MGRPPSFDVHVVSGAHVERTMTVTFIFCFELELFEKPDGVLRKPVDVAGDIDQLVSAGCFVTNLRILRGRIRLRRSV